MFQDNDPGESRNPLKRLRNPFKSLGNPLAGRFGALRRLPLPVVGGVAAIAVIAIIFGAVALSSGGDDGDGETAAAPTATRTPRPVPTSVSGGLQTARPTPQATIDLARPTAQAVNATSVGPDDRLVIPRFGVEAPLTYRKVNTDGVMPNPEGPDDIAYYDFSDWPGKGGSPGNGGNVNVAGHVDSGSEPCDNGTVPPPCTAVLWDLTNLVVGDQIEMHWGGEVYTYEVQTNEPISATEGPWDQIVSSTAEETLTIITCGGDFNRETGGYTHRQVVTAVRVT